MTKNDKERSTRREKLLSLLTFGKHESWKIPRQVFLIRCWTSLCSSSGETKICCHKITSVNHPSASAEKKKENNDEIVDRLLSVVGEMRVFLKNLDGYVCPIDIEPCDNFSSVTEKVKKKTGIDGDMQKLIFQGRHLWAWPTHTMSEHNVQEGSMIHIIHRGPLERLSQWTTNTSIDPFLFVCSWINARRSILLLPLLLTFVRQERLLFWECLDCSLIGTLSPDQKWC